MTGAAFLLVFLVARGESLPDAPTAQIHPMMLQSGVKPAKNPSHIVDYSLWSAVAITRTLDWTSTEQCVRRPYCHEAELPEALVRNKAGFAFFEAGMTVASVEGQRVLEHRGHVKLARILQLADVAVMSDTVIHNYSQDGHTPL